MDPPNSPIKGPHQCGLAVPHGPLLSCCVLCCPTVPMSQAAASHCHTNCPLLPHTVPRCPLAVPPTLRPAGLVVTVGLQRSRHGPIKTRPRNLLSPSPGSSAHPRCGGPRTGGNTQKPSRRLKKTGNSVRGTAPPWGEAGTTAEAGLPAHFGGKVRVRRSRAPQRPLGSRRGEALGCGAPETRLGRQRRPRRAARRGWTPRSSPAAASPL